MFRNIAAIAFVAVSSIAFSGAAQAGCKVYGYGW